MGYTWEARGAVRELFKCKAKEILIEGPAGTGKTRGVLQKLYAIAQKYPKCRILLLRKFRVSLNDTVLVELERVMDGDRALLGADRSHRQRYTLANGSEIVLGGLDNPERFMSGNFDIVYVAEATEIAENDWEFVLTRLRNGVVPYQQAIADCNPGPPGHWLNQRADRLRDDGTPMMVRMLSRHTDNPRWDGASGKEYLEVLANLTGVRRARLFEGKWVASEGAVYADFDRARHVRPRDAKLAKRWFVGVDDGFRNAFCALRGWADADDSLHIEAEIYGSGKLEAEKVGNIGSLCGGVEFAAIDPAAAGLIQACRNANLPARSADNDVNAGIGRVGDYFKFNRLTIDPSCRNLISQLETYEWADNDRKDVPVKENDHAVDALRYMVMGLGRVGASVVLAYEAGENDADVSAETEPPSFETMRSDPTWGWTEMAREV